MYDWVTSHIRTSHVTHTIWITQSRHQFNFDVTRMIESRLTYECVTLRMYHTKQTPTLTFMSHTCLSQVSRMNESCHNYHMYHTKQILTLTFMSHVWLSHVSHMNESCHTYNMYHRTQTNDSSFKSHTWLSQASRINESCHTYHMYHTKQTNDSSFYQSSNGRLAKAGMYILFIFLFFPSCQFSVPPLNFFIPPAHPHYCIHFQFVWFLFDWCCSTF